jgi:hypothetical protein
MHQCPKRKSAELNVVMITHTYPAVGSASISG